MSKSIRKSKINWAALAALLIGLTELLRGDAASELIPQEILATVLSLFGIGIFILRTWFCSDAIYAKPKAPQHRYELNENQRRLIAEVDDNQNTEGRV